MVILFFSNIGFTTAQETSSGGLDFLSPVTPAHCEAEAKKILDNHAQIFSKPSLLIAPTTLAAATAATLTSGRSIRNMATRASQNRANLMQVLSRLEGLKSLQNTTDASEAGAESGTKEKDANKRRALGQQVVLKIDAKIRDFKTSANATAKELAQSIVSSKGWQLSKFQMNQLTQSIHRYVNVKVKMNGVLNSRISTGMQTLPKAVAKLGSHSTNRGSLRSGAAVAGSAVVGVLFETAVSLYAAGKACENFALKNSARFFRGNLVSIFQARKGSVKCLLDRSALTHLRGLNGPRSIKQACAKNPRGFLDALENSQEEYAQGVVNAGQFVNTSSAMKTRCDITKGLASFEVPVMDADNRRLAKVTVEYSDLKTATIKVQDLTSRNQRVYTSEIRANGNEAPLFIQTDSGSLRSGMGDQAPTQSNLSRFFLRYPRAANDDTWRRKYFFGAGLSLAPAMQSIQNDCFSRGYKRHQNQQRTTGAR